MSECRAPRFTGHLQTRTAASHGAIRDLDISPAGRVVHLRGYDRVRVLQTVSPHGDAVYGATRDLMLPPLDGKNSPCRRGPSKDCHRDLKQCMGGESTGTLRPGAFLRLEHCWLCTGVNGYELQISIVRETVRQ